MQRAASDSISRRVAAVSTNASSGIGSGNSSASVPRSPLAPLRAASGDVGDGEALGAAQSRLEVAGACKVGDAPGRVTMRRAQRAPRARHRRSPLPQLRRARRRTAPARARRQGLAVTLEAAVGSGGDQPGTAPAGECSVSRRRSPGGDSAHSTGIAAASHNHGAKPSGGSPSRNGGARRLCRAQIATASARASRGWPLRTTSAERRRAKRARAAGRGLPQARRQCRCIRPCRRARPAA